MDFGKIGEELFGDISEGFDNFCSEVDDAINSKLSAVGAHIKEFWSEIVQDKIPKSPKNVVDVIEEEVTNFSDSQKPTAIVDDEKNNINLCPTSEVCIVVPEDHLQRKSFLQEIAAMGMHNSKNAGNKENCIDEAEISSLKSFESISGSCIEQGTSRHVDTNTEVPNDQQAKLSDRGVVSHDLQSMLLSLRKLDVSGTEDGTDLEDYAEVDEISLLEWSAVGANGPLVTEEFMHTTQSQLAEPELYEDYFLVNTSELSSIPDLEKNNGTSKIKSAEAKENEHLGDQEPDSGFSPTSPTANSVRWDEEFSEDDWVVV